MSTEATTEATTLIARSQSHNEIARAAYSDELHAALCEAADDWTDADDGYDYWSEDEDGEMTWRVHTTFDVV